MSSIRAVRRQDRHAAPQYPQMFLIRHESTAVGGNCGRTINGVKYRESRSGRRFRGKKDIGHEYSNDWLWLAYTLDYLERDSLNGRL